MESVAFIEWCLEHLNYWTITFLMAIESSFIPFPSEVVVPPAAWLAADASSGLNVYLVVVAATAGALIGAFVNYFLALWLGRPIIYKFANSRFGHMCLIDEAGVKKAEEYFEKRGAVSTFVGRLIPAVRQLISIPAGISRMPLVPFTVFTALGAGIWSALLAVTGFAISRSTGDISYLELVTRGKAAVMGNLPLFIGGAVALVVVYWLATRLVMGRK
jgi:membrane protein DedA with SNARE-associated domain